MPGLPGDSDKKIKRAAAKGIGKSMDAVMEFVDVDGVVRKIDVNNVVERIDVNALLDRVDIDTHLNRVDVNRHLERVDFNQVLSRVDMNALMHSSDLGLLVAKSSTGVFTHLLDQIRIQVALIDQVLQNICQSGFRGWKGYKELPPAPGNIEQTPPPAYPKGISNKAVALQGRAAGGLSQQLAWWLDNFIIAIIFSIFVKVVEVLWQSLIPKNRTATIDESNWFFSLVFAIEFLVYHFAWVALTGGTIGLAVFGLVVAGADGSSITPRKAAIRTVLEPIMVTTVVGVLVGFLRTDRRPVHDLLAGTTVVYAWDAAAAGLRERELQEMERIEPVFPSVMEAGTEGTTTEGTEVAYNISKKQD